MTILKLRHDDPQKELEFELMYQKTLTTNQRFQMMRQKGKEILERLIRNGHRKSSEIIKRK